MSEIDRLIGPSPVQFPNRRSARKLGVQAGPVKGGFPGYKVRRGSAGGGTSSSGGNKRETGGLNFHNSPLSYKLQPKRGRNV